jgi:hypothetical protein
MFLSNRDEIRKSYRGPSIMLPVKFCFLLSFGSFERPLQNLCFSHLEICSKNKGLKSPKRVFLFLAHLAKRPCELMPSLVVCCRLSFHIWIFFSETAWPNERKLSIMLPVKFCFLLSFGSFGQVVSEKKIFRNRPTRNKKCLLWPCLLMDQGGTMNSYFVVMMYGRSCAKFPYSVQTNIADIGSSCLWLANLKKSSLKSFGQINWNNISYFVVYCL